MTPQFTTVTLQRLVNLAWSTNYLLTNAARIARHGWYIVDCCVIFSTRLVNLLLRACYIGMECLLHVMICHNSVCQFMSTRMPRWIVHTFTVSHYRLTRAYRLLVKITPMRCFTRLCYDMSQLSTWVTFISFTLILVLFLRLGHIYTLLY